MARVLENLPAYDAKNPAWKALEQEAYRNMNLNRGMIESAAPSGLAGHDTLKSRNDGLRQKALDLGATAVEAPRH